MRHNHSHLYNQLNQLGSFVAKLISQQNLQHVQYVTRGIGHTTIVSLAYYPEYLLNTQLHLRLI